MTKTIICARTMRNTVDLLKPGVLVVTPGDRDDIILAVSLAAINGVPLAGLSLGSLAEPVPLGIALGLFAGKQVGIFAGAASLFAFVRPADKGPSGSAVAVVPPPDASTQAIPPPNTPPPPRSIAVTPTRAAASSPAGPRHPPGAGQRPARDRRPRRPWRQPARSGPGMERAAARGKCPGTGPRRG